MAALSAPPPAQIRSFCKYLISFFFQNGKRNNPVSLSSTHSPFSLDSTTHLYVILPRRYSFNRQSEVKPNAKQFKASSLSRKSSCQPSKETVYEPRLTVRPTVNPSSEVGNTLTELSSLSNLA